MWKASEEGSAGRPADGLARRMEDAAAAARRAALEPGGAVRLVEALAEMAECLVEAEAELRGGGSGQARLLRPVLEQCRAELRRMETYVGGALELVAGWSGAGGPAAGYGGAVPEAGRRAVRVDEAG
jgi:hypothetical protein